jgi:molecular chaperone Hsp33
MGDLTAMPAAMADSLKYDELFILQTQSDSPVSMMVVDVTSDGTIRGYARYDKDSFYRDTEFDTAVPHIIGSGHIAYTVDQGLDTKRYQGSATHEGRALLSARNPTSANPNNRRRPSYWRLMQQPDTLQP